MAFDQFFAPPHCETHAVQGHDSSRPILYFGAGELSLAIHILLHEVGADFRLVAVDPHAQRTDDGDDYRAINPSGRVPALALPSGKVITDLTAMLQHVADHAPEGVLMPPPGHVRRSTALTWVRFLEELQRQFALLFDAEAPPANARDLTAALCGQLDVVAHDLQASPYLLGTRFSAPDALLFVVSGWMRFVGLRLDRWPALVDFRRRVATRPAVIKAFVEEGLTLPFDFGRAADPAPTVNAHHSASRAGRATQPSVRIRAGRRHQHPALAAGRGELHLWRSVR